MAQVTRVEGPGAAAPRLGDRADAPLLCDERALELVNRAYAKELSAPITVADLNTHDPRIVRQVEAYFRDRNIAGGQFNHYRSAVTLLREQAGLIPKIDAATLARAEQLFIRLNELLP